MRIGIIGNGFVGRATRLFSTNCRSLEVITYDIRKEYCEPLETTLAEVDETCELIFVCLPTPLNHDGSADTSLIDNTLQQLKNPYVVVRSTVPIGYCANRCYYMPEFLTEANWRSDFYENPHWIVGMKDNSSRFEVTADLESDPSFKYSEAYEFYCRMKYLLTEASLSNNIACSKMIVLTSTEAEAVKTFKNGYLSAKVSIMNEFYDFVDSLREENVDYDRIVNTMALDPRIGSSHMRVPGHDGHRGFGGTCFPKDTFSLYRQFQSRGIPSPIYSSVLHRNETIDRPERDWVGDVGRTTLLTSRKISLVAGGAGFIGKYLCRYLLEKTDHIVVCMDNLCSSSVDAMDTVRQLRSDYPRRFMFVKADIVVNVYLPRVDYVWNLACRASPPKYQADGYHTLQTSVVGTMNLLELVRVHKARYLFTSTSEIYGDPLEHPQKETYWGNVNTVGVRSCYDEGKRCAETFLYEFARKHPSLASHLRIARIFNTYGEGMCLRDGRVITNFIDCILREKPLEIYGDGEQTRSFCHVSDTVDGLVRLMFYDTEEYERMFKSPSSAKVVVEYPLIVNIGNPWEITMNHLHRLFESSLGRAIPVVRRPLPKDDPHKRQPDITKARAVLQWQPVVNIGDILSKLVEHYRSQTLPVPPPTITF